MALQTFQAFIKQNNIDVEILEASETTHTAQQAADAFHVPVSNIVKSLLVCADDSFALFLVPGDKRLDLEQVKKKLDKSSARMATADEVKNITGYSIGGVPPFGHTKTIATFIADGFAKDELLVAAAGSANSVFKISFDSLQEILKRIKALD